MTWTRVVMLRRKWTRVLPHFDVRECPTCGALVFRQRGQDVHQAWHDELDSGAEVVILAREGSDDDD